VLTRDPDTAVAFYTSLLGWVAAHDEATGYTTFSLDDEPVAGMMAMPAEVPAEAPSHWLAYFAVSDCEKSARRVEDLGGTVHHPPQGMGIGVFAVVEDPHGASFCLFEPRGPLIDTGDG
jgi:predicted enzyme related to lactoylglutathione lyase